MLGDATGMGRVRHDSTGVFYFSLRSRRAVNATVEGLGFDSAPSSSKAIWVLPTVPGSTPSLKSAGPRGRWLSAKANSPANWCLSTTVGCIPSMAVLRRMGPSRGYAVAIFSRCLPGSRSSRGITPSRRFHPMINRVQCIPARSGSTISILGSISLNMATPRGRSQAS